MILFTSDLDRTLIYSNSMMGKYPVATEVIAIEYKDNEAISYMTQSSIELLRAFNDNQLFVPVTTRAVYQYERIDLFKNDIQPKYAITSNGGTILVDGKVDMEWDKLIRNKLAVTAIPNEDMLHIFSEIQHEEWIAREFYVDELFYMFHVHQEFVPHTELAAFNKKLEKLGWHLFLHGKRLYILPVHLKKSSAVAQIQNYMTYNIHVAAGDSMMDYDMLIQADIGYSPRHGELFEKQGNLSGVTWLNGAGASSAEHLLKNIMQLNKKASYFKL